MILALWRSRWKYRKIQSVRSNDTLLSKRREKLFTNHVNTTTANTKQNLTCSVNQNM